MSATNSHTAELLRLATLPQNTRENWSKATVVQFTDAVARLLSDRNATQHNSELVGLLEAADICDKMAADEFKTQQYDRTDKAMYACHKRIMERFAALKKAAPQGTISSHNENGPASHTTPLSPPCVVESPVAWRYKYGIDGEWRYVDVEDLCNDFPGYYREPLYHAPSAVPDADCLTCHGDPAMCASVPGLRHCEKANREEQVPAVDTTEQDEADAQRRRDECIGRYGKSTDGTPER